ncbi:multi antimicrobial extrusion [Paratrimastix pyriformis]|uniref:Multi antimicrobial extrusion n=1 Tax=Paratrimastix pyriformis TaxID=342808 RepID=A0ABQ8U8N9_9EUKA|nr:multi antimicrobial extrusion [Paratrimastix pyriformis]
MDSTDTEGKQPILSPTRPPVGSPTGPPPEPEPDGDARTIPLKQELKIQVKLALPVVATLFTSMLSLSIVLVFLGKFGAATLAAATLANLLANISGFSICWGILSGIDTLSAQAFGAGALPRVGLVAQRGMIISLLTSIPIGCLWIFSGPVFSLLTPDPDVAAMAIRFLWWRVPGLPVSIIYEGLRRYLQAQGQVFAILLAQLTSLGGTMLLCWLLIDVAGIGYLGAAMAVSLNQLVLSLFLVGYIYVKRAQFRSTWPAPSRAMFRGWCEFLKFGIPGAAMSCLEWWVYEFSNAFVAFISTEALAAYSVMITYSSLIYMIPLGFSVAAAVRVGHLLGANAPKNARRASFVNLGMALCTLILPFGFLIIVRGDMIVPFSTDPAMIAVAEEAAVIMAFFILFDGTQCAIGGILRGLGKQTAGATVNLLTYYGVAVPLQAMFTFLWNWKNIKGIWLAALLAAFLTAAIFLVICLRTNWPRSAQAAVVRSRAEQAHVPPPPPLAEAHPPSLTTPSVRSRDETGPPRGYQAEAAHPPPPGLNAGSPQQDGSQPPASTTQPELTGSGVAGDDQRLGDSAVAPPTLTR